MSEDIKKKLDFSEDVQKNVAKALKSDKSTGRKLIEQTIKELSIIEPEEERLACPECSSIDTFIESYHNNYPFFRCRTCNVGFFQVAFRAACKKWHKAVTKKQCSGCFFFKSQIQCEFWNGILEPPHPLAIALKQKMLQDQKPPKTLGRKVA